MSFTSLFFDPDLNFFSLLSTSSFNLFVALCSASFLFSKSLTIDGFFVPEDGLKFDPLLKLNCDLNLPLDPGDLKGLPFFVYLFCEV